MGLIFPIVLVAVWVAVTILASNDGAWGAGLICVSTLFAGPLYALFEIAILVSSRVEKKRAANAI